MNFLESIGFLLVALMACIGFAVTAYVLYEGSKLIGHHQLRGKFENDLDIKKAVENRYVEGMMR